MKNDPVNCTVFNISLHIHEVFCVFFKSTFIYLFIYVWLCWVFVSVRGLFSSCGERGPLFIVVRGPLTIAASRYGAQAPDAQAQKLWLTGLVAPRQIGRAHV